MTRPRPRRRGGSAAGRHIKAQPPRPPAAARWWWRGFAIALGGVLAVVLLLGAGGRAAAEGGARADGRISYDAGADFGPAAPLPGVPASWLRGIPVELLIEFFTECQPGDTARDCGPPHARWTESDVPVRFCTFHRNRPPGISAADFRAAVAAAAATWNEVEAAAGIEYSGDCPTGFRWEPSNDRNEIGFDDERDVVGGQEAGLARGAWVTSFPFTGAPTATARDFTEADIILDGGSLTDVPEACVRSVIAHELGHTLGYGHSDDAVDLMFPSFNASDPATCQAGPSAAERSFLQALYGVDRAPTVSAGADRTVDASALVALTAVASDPEGGAISFEWAQVGGAAVATQTSGATLSFTSPTQQGATLSFEVTARDRFLHMATDVVAVTVLASDAPPALPITFESFLRDASLARVAIEWGGAAGASSFEICSAATTVGLATSCTATGEPSLAVTWDAVLGPAGNVTDRRVVGGWRHTQLRGCNSAGCTPFVGGPISGGVRWPAWQIDYDYFAMAFDIGSLRFTIVGAVNLGGPARTFIFTNGPAADEQTRTIGRCTSIRPGGVCIHFLAFGDDPQQAIVGIESRRGDTPNTLHYIPVR